MASSSCRGPAAFEILEPTFEFFDAIKEFWQPCRERKNAPPLEFECSSIALALTTALAWTPGMNSCGCGPNF